MSCLLEFDVIYCFLHFISVQFNKPLSSQVPRIQKLPGPWFMSEKLTLWQKHKTEGDKRCVQGSLAHQEHPAACRMGAEGVLMGNTWLLSSDLVGLMPKSQAGDQVAEDSVLHPVPSRSYGRSGWWFRLFSLAAVWRINLMGARILVQRFLQ